MIRRSDRQPRRRLPAAACTSIWNSASTVTGSSTPPGGALECSRSVIGQERRTFPSSIQVVLAHISSQRQRGVDIRSSVRVAFAEMSGPPSSPPVADPAVYADGESREHPFVPVSAAARPAVRRRRQQLVNLHLLRFRRRSVREGVVDDPQGSTNVRGRRGRRHRGTRPGRSGPGQLRDGGVIVEHRVTTWFGAAEVGCFTPAQVGPADRRHFGRGRCLLRPPSEPGQEERVAAADRADVGVWWAWRLRRRPDVYARIGMGVAAGRWEVVR
jgi:hypothetical protein